jgi:hypothetical protein
MPGTWTRRAPLTGVVAVLLFVAAAIVGGETPDFDAPGQEVIDFYVENEGSQFAASILAAYGGLFLIFFAGALRSVLRRTEAAPGGLSAVAFGGGLVAAVGVLTFAGLSFTLADGGEALEPGAAQALSALNGDFFFPLATGISALLLSSGIAMVRSDALPGWLGWIAIVLGVLAVTPVGFFAFLAGLIWIVVTAIVFTVRPVAGAGPPPREAVPPPSV